MKGVVSSQDGLLQCYDCKRENVQYGNHESIKNDHATHQEDTDPCSEEDQFKFSARFQTFIPVQRNISTNSIFVLKHESYYYFHKGTNSNFVFTLPKKTRKKNAMVSVWYPMVSQDIVDHHH
jgi:hypothetical protein